MNLNRTVPTYVTGLLVAALDIINTTGAMVITSSSTSTNPLGAVIPAAAGLHITGYLLILTLSTVAITLATAWAVNSHNVTVRTIGGISLGVLAARAAFGLLITAYLALTAGGLVA